MLLNFSASCPQATSALSVIMSFGASNLCVFASCRVVVCRIVSTGIQARRRFVRFQQPPAAYRSLPSSLQQPPATSRSLQKQQINANRSKSAANQHKTTANQCKSAAAQPLRIELKRKGGLTLSPPCALIQFTFRLQDSKSHTFSPILT